MRGSAATGSLQAIVVLILATALAGGALGQAANQVKTVSPATATAGAAGIVVTFTLDTDFPPPPPAGDGPQSVTIGGVAGTGITHTSANKVTATFTFPATTAAGAKDVAITFAIPGGTLLFSLAGGFTVAGGGDEYTMERTLADGAQLNTIAFDGLAFLTGSLGGQVFLPPGKVADYSGFQYLRDNDPTQMGHNTDFVTIIAANVLNILDEEQLARLVARAEAQVDLINSYAWGRYPLADAFRRQLDGDIPAGSAGLDKGAVMRCSGDLYRIDGAISFDRARLLGGIVRSFTPAQKAAMDSLGTLGGVGNWDDTLPDPLRDLRLDHDVNIAVMTYASEMYGWYAGTVVSDVYFCPERQGTYFGSFYLKDWPAMGNPNYTINEQLTASAGERFLSILDASQRAVVTNLLEEQRAALYGIVDARTEIAGQLRRFLVEASVDSASVLDLSARYGALDGVIIHAYATRFSQVAATLSTAQKAQLTALADSLGYVPAAGGFLYSTPVAMPAIANTDFLFAASASGVGDEGSSRGGRAPSAAPNPFNPRTTVSFTMPAAGHARLTLHDVRGRLVRTLADADLPAGEQVLVWDGRDDQGRDAASGTYVLRVEAGTDISTGKLTLVR